MKLEVTIDRRGDAYIVQSPATPGKAGHSVVVHPFITVAEIHEKFANLQEKSNEPDPRP